MKRLIDTVKPRLPRGIRLAALAGIGAIASFLLPSPVPALSATGPEGLVCTSSTGTTAGYASFLLKTATGYVKTPDGNLVFMWGYSNGNASFQYPGPVLCVNEGDNVTITLRNTFDFPTSLIFPGLTKVRANGKIEQMDMGHASLGQVAAGATPRRPETSITYTFIATNPGTYIYESGTDPQVQVFMGMVGAIVVRPALNPDDLNNPSSCASLAGAGKLPAGATYVQGEGLVYDDCASAYNPQREFMHMLTEVDPHMHAAIEKMTCADVPPTAVPPCVKGYNPNQDGNNQGNNLPFTPTYDMARYIPRYFFINGRNFPDDITPNFSPALPSQPYGALVHVRPKNFDPTSIDYNPLPALVRFLSGGPVTYPFHPHSNHDTQIATDGRMLSDGPTDVSFDRFGFVMAPGQTADALFNWSDGQGFAANPPGIGVPEPNQLNRTDGQFWSGTPYLGMKLPLNPGRQQWNACGEYYQFAHSHALFQITNYGASGGGMLTLIRVDPTPSFQKAHGQTCDNDGPGYPAP